MSEDQITGPGGGPSGRDSDRPARLLRILSGRTSVGRGEWGQAMLAELDEIAGSRARWQFAIGSARTMVLPSPLSLVGLIPLAVAAAGAIALYIALPGLGFWAIAVPGAPCLCAWAAVARPTARPSRGVSSRAGQIVAIAVLLACPLLGLRLLTLSPGGAGGSAISWAIVSTTFCADMVAYLLLVLRRPDPLGAWRYSGVLGLGAALAIGGVFQLNQPPGGLSSYLPAPVANSAVVGTAIATPVAAGVLAALLSHPRGGLGQRLRSGAGEMLWACLLSAPVVFIGDVLATSRSAIATEAAQPGTIVQAHQDGATSVLAWVSGDDVGAAVVMFALLSTASLLFFLAVHALSAVVRALSAARDERDTPAAAAFAPEPSSPAAGPDSA